MYAASVSAKAPVPNLPAGEPLRLFLVEDETPSVQVIEHYCNALGGMRVAAVARSGEEARRLYQPGKFDVALLDINLPDQSGIDIARWIGDSAPVIFVTAFDSHAVRAFETGARDYLLKPFPQARFAQAIQRARASLLSGATPGVEANGLLVRHADNLFYVKHSSILYIRSQGKRSTIHMHDGAIETAQLLAALHSRLPGKSFFRVHKQFVVNVEYIRRMQHIAKGDYVLYLRDPDETPVPLSRMYAGQLKQRLGFEQR